MESSPLVTPLLDAYEQRRVDDLAEAHLRGRQTLDNALSSTLASVQSLTHALSCGRWVFSAFSPKAPPLPLSHDRDCRTHSSMLANNDTQLFHESFGTPSKGSANAGEAGAENLLQQLSREPISASSLITSITTALERHGDPPPGRSAEMENDGLPVDAADVALWVQLNCEIEELREMQTYLKRVTEETVTDILQLQRSLVASQWEVEQYVPPVIERGRASDGSALRKPPRGMVSPLHYSRGSDASVSKGVGASSPSFPSRGLDETRVAGGSVSRRLFLEESTAAAVAECDSAVRRSLRSPSAVATAAASTSPIRAAGDTEDPEWSVMGLPPGVATTAHRSMRVGPICAREPFQYLATRVAALEDEIRQWEFELLRRSKDLCGVEELLRQSDLDQASLLVQERELRKRLTMARDELVTEKIALKAATAATTASERVRNALEEQLRDAPDEEMIMSDTLALQTKTAELNRAIALHRRMCDLIALLETEQSTDDVACLSTMRVDDGEDTASASDKFPRLGVFTAFRDHNHEDDPLTVSTFTLGRSRSDAQGAMTPFRSSSTISAGGISTSVSAGQSPTPQRRSPLQVRRRGTVRADRSPVSTSRSTVSRSPEMKPIPGSATRKAKGSTVVHGCKSSAARESALQGKRQVRLQESALLLFDSEDVAEGAVTAIRDRVQQLLRVREAILILSAHLFDFCADLPYIEKQTNELKANKKWSSHFASTAESNQWRSKKLQLAYEEIVDHLQLKKYVRDTSAAQDFVAKLKYFCVLYNLFEVHVEAIIQAVMLSSSMWAEAHDLLPELEKAKAVIERAARRRKKKP